VRRSRIGCCRPQWTAYLVIDRVPTLRVLVIITFRPEFAPPSVGRPHVTMLNLNRLPPRLRAQMITYVTGGKALPREIADQIINRTDGVPLFIDQLSYFINFRYFNALACDHPFRVTLWGNRDGPSCISVRSSMDHRICRGAS
jgi:predicted ATPase